MTVEWTAFKRAMATASGSCAGVLTGWMSSQVTAVNDPLFFLTVANVDRLWAKWQYQANRLVATDPNAYGAGIVPCGGGQCLTDTMWPWNAFGAPGGAFPVGLGPGVSGLFLPPAQPMPLNAVNYWNTYVAGGTAAPTRLTSGLGFGYTDVPYSP